MCRARARGDRELACLSVGCASGEEAYSLKILWALGCDDEREGLALRITGVDSHPVMLERARRGCFHPGSLKDLPESWRSRAFERGDGEACLRAEFRGGIDFVRGDVRRALPAGPFDLILSDQRMPGMLGTEFFELVTRDHPDIRRILISGYSDFSKVTEAFNDGVIHKFVVKPWNNEQLRALVADQLDEQVEFLWCEFDRVPIAVNGAGTGIDGQVANGQDRINRLIRLTTS